MAAHVDSVEVAAPCLQPQFLQGPLPDDDLVLAPRLEGAGQVSALEKHGREGLYSCAPCSCEGRASTSGKSNSKDIKATFHTYFPLVLEENKVDSFL